jgi:uncharacterized membrane protein YfcA
MVPSERDIIVDITATTVTVSLAGVFLIAFMKGAFGGGFAVIGIPLLSLVMSPLTAGALLAPLFVAMDLFALRYWKPSTWSKQDLTILVPSLLMGIGLFAKGAVVYQWGIRATACCSLSMAALSSPIRIWGHWRCASARREGCSG